MNQFTCVQSLLTWKFKDIRLLIKQMKSNLLSDSNSWRCSLIRLVTCGYSFRRIPHLTSDISMLLSTSKDSSWGCSTSSLKSLCIFFRAWSCFTLQTRVWYFFSSSWLRSNRLIGNPSSPSSSVYWNIIKEIIQNGKLALKHQIVLESKKHVFLRPKCSDIF